MSDSIIRVENLGKKYRISREQSSGSVRYRAFRDVLAERSCGLAKAFLAPFGKGKKDLARRLSLTEDFWALRNCTFEIKQGERIGIIGKNGAGKTTILKLLSRITEPTEGSIYLKGRVASLLEVGTGFHPELTGKENIFLNGAIMGMTRQQIRKKFDEIVAFAEVGKFIDTPMKRYSSGMQVRLAFSISAHLEQEILLVDEVLAVGDAAFQKKCLKKMDDVAKVGRTIVFVSHQLAQVSALCTRAIQVHQGMLVRQGDVRQVLDAYINSFKDYESVSLKDRLDRSGSGLIRAIGAWMENENGDRAQHFLSGSMVKFIIEYESFSDKRIENVIFGMGIHSSMGVYVTELGSHLIGKNIDVSCSRAKIECVIPRLPLNNGMFNCNLMIRSGKSGNEVFDYVVDAFTFTVEPGDFFGTGNIPGNPILMNLDYEYKPSAK